MRTAPHASNRSLLLALTTAMAACGGSTSSSNPHGGNPGDAAPGHGGTTSAAGQGGVLGGASGGASGLGGTKGLGGAAHSGGAGAGGAMTAAGGSGAATAGGATSPGGATAGGATGSGGATSAGGAAGKGGGPADAGTDASCPPGFYRIGDRCLYTVRRPFLVGSELRSALPAGRSDWLDVFPESTTDLDEPTRRRLAGTWLRDGLEEHASVAAFARMTLQLLSLGAPPHFVLGAQRASLDEIRHAKACLGLAARYGSEELGPARLDLDDAFGPSDLVSVARLCAEEGCVGETLGAVLAREQLAVARDGAVVKALRRIVRDEARHAELAWQFVRWAVLRGGPEVRDAVADAIERAIAGTLAMEIASYAGIDLDVWHAHGRLTCRESRAVAERAIVEIVRPGRDVLLRRAA